VTIKILSRDFAVPTCEIVIEDLADCRLFAEQVAAHIAVPIAIALSGTLGAGKTQWTRFFAIALGALPETVSSPTFMLVHEYDSRPPVFHLDAYRIGDEDEMLELGIEEMFESDGVTIVEWADRFPRLLPRQTLRIHFEVGESQVSRQVQLQASGERSISILKKLIALWE
jgi:tRNA threonylcarbamoyladenosine biosynthesis protein TsaE